MSFHQSLYFDERSLLLFIQLIWSSSQQICDFQFLIISDSLLFIVNSALDIFHLKSVALVCLLRHQFPLSMIVCFEIEVFCSISQICWHMVESLFSLHLWSWSLGLCQMLLFWSFCGTAALERGAICSRRDRWLLMHVSVRMSWHGWLLGNWWMFARWGLKTVLSTFLRLLGRSQFLFADIMTSRGNFHRAYLRWTNDSVLDTSKAWPWLCWMLWRRT